MIDDDVTGRSLAAAMGLEHLLERIRGVPEDQCQCTASFDGETLVVDANECNGTLASAPECRRTVIQRLTETDATSLLVETNGLENRYGQPAVDLLAAAGRFVALLGNRDQRLARLAATDPLGAASELRARIGPVVDVARDAGLLAAADGIDGYQAAFAPDVGLTIGHFYLDRAVGGDGRLRDVTSLETGSEVRIYDRASGVPLYALDVVDVDLDERERRTLLEGYEAIADGSVEGERAPARAIQQVADEEIDPSVTAVLEKHTRGYGVLEDLFADDRVTDVYVTSPVAANPIRVEVDGQELPTNVRLTERGVDAMASRIRRVSGRAFSRANPTVDATARLDNGVGLRVAGVTDPVAEGVAFAFRERADDRFTLPSLVANGTTTPEVAAFLSVAIERNAAALIAGTRGAGKTTLLGTLLYELPPGTRTVVIEDTPELPVDPLQSIGRDVQPLRTGTGEGPEITAVEALRTALRLGDGALVVGEIRGEEAQVLYEAMRVGANANAVLGTIHGDGAEDIFERVVSDLDVPASSFGATDLVVTVQAYDHPEGRKRRVSRIEEVIVGDDEIRFEPLYAIDEDLARPTGRIDRGESRFVDHVTEPGESYADVRAAIDDRASALRRLVAEGRTGPQDVAVAYAESRT